MARACNVTAAGDHGRGRGACLRLGERELPRRGLWRGRGAAVAAARHGARAQQLLHAGRQVAHRQRQRARPAADEAKFLYKISMFSFSTET